MKGHKSLIAAVYKFIKKKTRGQLKPLDIIESMTK